MIVNSENCKKKKKNVQKRFHRELNFKCKNRCIHVLQNNSTLISLKLCMEK